MQSKTLLKTSQVAKKYGLQNNTVQHWCRTKKIPSIKIGGRYFIDEKTVMSLVEGK